MKTALANINASINSGMVATQKARCVGELLRGISVVWSKMATSKHRVVKQMLQAVCGKRASKQQLRANTPSATKQKWADGVTLSLV